MQHNVLDAKLGQIAAFIKKRANTILWAVLLAAIAVFIGTWGWRKYSDSIRQPQMDFEALTVRLNARDANMDDVLTKLKALAGQDSNRKVAAAASLSAAVEYANQALMARDQLTKSQQESAASEMYNSVIGRFSDMPEQVAKAYLGLGELAAGKGEIAAAKSNYEQALKLAPNGYPVKEFASKALADLDRLAVPVALAATAPFEPSSAPGVPAPSLPKNPVNPGQPGTPASPDPTPPARDVPIHRNPQK